MIIVGGDAPWTADVGDVDDPEPAVPAARPHLVSEAERVVERNAPVEAASEIFVEAFDPSHYTGIISIHGGPESQFRPGFRPL